MKRKVQVFRVSAMDEYEMDGKDEVELLHQAIERARTGFVGAPPDCTWLAVIPRDQSTLASERG